MELIAYPRRHDARDHTYPLAPSHDKVTVGVCTGQGLTHPNRMQPRRSHIKLF